MLYLPHPLRLPYNSCLSNKQGVANEGIGKGKEGGGGLRERGFETSEGVKGFDHFIFDHESPTFLKVTVETKKALSAYK